MQRWVLLGTAVVCLPRPMPAQELPDSVVQELARLRAQVDSLTALVARLEAQLAARPAAPQSARSATPACTGVDINSASSTDLQRIVQVGPARAQAIIRIRAERRFASVDDLTRVSGIGASHLATIKAQGLACVGGVAFASPLGDPAPTAVLMREEPGEAWFRLR